MHMEHRLFGLSRNSLTEFVIVWSKLATSEIVYCALIFIWRNILTFNNKTVYVISRVLYAGLHHKQSYWFTTDSIIRSFGHYTYIVVIFKTLPSFIFILLIVERWCQILSLSGCKFLFHLILTVDRSDVAHAVMLGIKANKDQDQREVILCFRTFSDSTNLFSWVHASWLSTGIQMKTSVRDLLLDSVCFRRISASVRQLTRSYSKT